MPANKSNDVAMQNEEGQPGAQPNGGNMDIDQDFSQSADPSYKLPNYGTKRHTETVEPTIPNPTSVAELFEEYKQFALLYKQDEMNSNPDAGTPAYLLHSDWMKNYMEFILFDQFRANVSESSLKIDAETHFQEKNPGKIQNEKYLCEEDTEGGNIYGTGTIKGMEHDYVDMYVDSNRNPQSDYYMLNQELWQFLFKRYGGQQITRMYYRSSQYGNYTSVESKLRAVPIKLLNSEYLRTGGYDKVMFKQWWTQVSKNSQIKDLKKRIRDTLNAAGYAVVDSDVRIWLYNQDRENEHEMENRCGQVKEGFESGDAASETNPNIEFNSGIEFPGQTLEPLMNSALRLNQLTLNNKSSLIIEYRPTSEGSFAFKFEKGQNLTIGICEWCNSKNILRTVCKCKNVKYCNDECMEKDLRFHQDKCSANADQELVQDDDTKFNSSSKQGLVGLTNLGNTCYMNSSIQCMANTYELTKYFMDKKYKSLVERENKNPLGTDGRIVLAWAKLVGEMWYGSGGVVRPDLFKRILGQYNVTFEGYGQHDSQECINTVLDFMSEDLFKHNKKPYVEQTDADGKTDEEASSEAWNKHVYRNESIILDLFHGQYKSTVVCSLCKRTSVTFDPFLMVALPIPTTKWETISGYMIQYDQNRETYNNHKVQVKVKDNERVADFREKIQEVYGFEASSFLIAWVCDMKVEKLFNNTQKVKELTDPKQGVLLMFEIPKNLNPCLPSIETIKKDDSNNGLDQDWCKIFYHIFKDGTLLNLPRLFYAKKSWTLKELHVQFFESVKDLISRWLKDVKDEGKSARCKQQPPYKNAAGEELTYDMFEAMGLTEQFAAIFPGLTEENYQQSLAKSRWDLADMPYQLRIENTSAYSQDCHFCNQHSCRQNCPLPYTDTLTLTDMLHRVGVEDNVSFYHGKGGKSDVILNLQWHRDFEKAFQRHLSAVTDGKRLQEDDAVEERSEAVRIDECFAEFRNPEILDEDNKWYCSTCKEHVQASKELQIYKAPPVFIINLKRFSMGKQSRFMSMFGGSAGGTKIDEQVDFPLDGLDMSKFIVGSTEGQSMIYDCYAVSNHFGNMGFGHYTAFAKNALTDKWYEFDDSRVQQIHPDRVKQTVCTNAAYNLFYRRRDWHEKNKEEGIDFDKMAMKPDLSLLEKGQKS